MTIDFRLHVAILRLELDIYAPFIQRVIAQLPAYFAYATRNGYRINLHLNLDNFYSKRVDPLLELNAEQLNNCLNELLPWPQERHSLGVNEIGLLFGDSLASAPGVFGMMFDPGWLGGETAASIPRQGAAVFLDAIRAARGNLTEFERQLLFSCLHELGHVFNLWHIDDGNNLMSSSRGGPNAFPNSAFAFTALQCHFLSLAGRFQHVHPGGTRFGDRGPNYPAESNLNDLPEEKEPLSLALKVEKRAHWAFEPIELDVIVKLSSRSRKPLEIPDEIDPGYDSFELWIESPTGQVEKYQPLSHFCHNGTQVVQPGQRLQRDICITWNKAGFTFRASGIYYLWARFRPSENFVIVSKRVKVTIRPAEPDNKDFIKAERLLTQQNIARILHYKSADPQSAEFKALTNHRKTSKYVGLNASLSYILGRSYSRALRNRPSIESKPTSSWKHSARKELLEATRHLPRWSHRSRKASQLLKTDLL